MGLPNPAPATLKAVLICVDPVAPLKGDLHIIERETVLLGFRTTTGNRLEAVLLTRVLPDEVVVIVDTSGRNPTWTLLDAPAKDGRWQLSKWSEVIDEVMRRARVSSEVTKLPANSLTAPAIGGFSGDQWGTWPTPTPTRSVCGPRAKAPPYPRDAA